MGCDGAGNENVGGDAVGSDAVEEGLREAVLVWAVCVRNSSAALLHWRTFCNIGLAISGRWAGGAEFVREGASGDGESLFGYGMVDRSDGNDDRDFGFMWRP